MCFTGTISAYTFMTCTDWLRTLFGNTAFVVRIIELTNCPPFRSVVTIINQTVFGVIQVFTITVISASWITIASTIFTIWHFALQTCRAFTSISAILSNPTSTFAFPCCVIAHPFATWVIASAVRIINTAGSVQVLNPFAGVASVVMTPIGWLVGALIVIFTHAFHDDWHTCVISSAFPSNATGVVSMTFRTIQTLTKISAIDFATVSSRNCASS